MRFIRPTLITDAMLAASNVPEDDYPVWVGDQPYTTGDYVIRTETHRIYSCTSNVTSSTPPEDDTINWNDEGPTNKWAMFDGTIESKTTQAESITIELKPGLVNALSVHEVYCRTITVNFSVNGESVFYAVYDQLDPNINVGDWYGWATEEVAQINFLYTGQLFDVGLLNVPSYSNGTLSVTFSNPGGTVNVGEVKVGLLFYIGKTQNNIDIGITDFSLRKYDEFGNLTKVARSAIKDAEVDVLIETNRLDEVFYMLYRYKDDDLVFIPAEQHGASIVYGSSSWRIKRKDSTNTMVSMTLEGRK